MERILDPINWLKVNLIVHEPGKLEMDLEKLLKKEEFSRLLRGENVTKKEEEKKDD